MDKKGLELLMERKLIEYNIMVNLNNTPLGQLDRTIYGECQIYEKDITQLALQYKELTGEYYRRIL